MIRWGERKEGRDAESGLCSKGREVRMVGWLVGDMGLIGMQGEGEWLESKQASKQERWKARAIKESGRKAGRQANFSYIPAD